MFIKRKSYDWTIFHSRVLDSLPYVNVMSSIRHIPIIIIDPEDFGIEQISDVLECFADFSSKKRNSVNTWSHSFEHGNLHLDQEQRMVSVCGKKIELTAKEFEILKLLMKNPKKVYTKEQIYSQIWDDAYLGDENAVNVHISRLRSKIEDNPRDPKYIVTVWGIGYKLGDI